MSAIVAIRSCLRSFCLEGTSFGCDPASTLPCAAGAVSSPRSKPSFLRFLEAAFEVPFPRDESPLPLFPEHFPLSTGRDGTWKSRLETKCFRKVRSGSCPPWSRAGAAGARCPRAKPVLGVRARSAAAATPLFPGAALGSASGPRLYFPFFGLQRASDDRERESSDVVDSCLRPRAARGRAAGPPIRGRGGAAGPGSSPSRRSCSPAALRPALGSAEGTPGPAAPSYGTGSCVGPRAFSLRGALRFSSP